MIERTGGTWACRRGRHEIDEHPRCEDALAHITALAESQRPSTIFLHHLDGAVHLVATLA